jgi:hypothetical protein
MGISWLAAEPLDSQELYSVEWVNALTGLCERKTIGMAKYDKLPSFINCYHLTAVWRTVLLSRDGAARLDRVLRYSSSGINLYCIEVGVQNAAHRLWETHLAKSMKWRHFVENKTEIMQRVLQT